MSVREFPMEWYPPEFTHRSKEKGKMLFELERLHLFPGLLNSRSKLKSDITVTLQKASTFPRYTPTILIWFGAASHYLTMKHA